jgi:hypothetical protein
MKLNFKSIYKVYLIILIIIGILMINNICFSCQKYEWKNVIEIHVVQNNETLDDIANMYMSDNVQFAEFKEGIIEINYDKVFKGRIPRDKVVNGDILQINHWVHNDEGDN